MLVKIFYSIRVVNYLRVCRQLGLLRLSIHVLKQEHLVYVYVLKWVHIWKLTFWFCWQLRSTGSSPRDKVQQFVFGKDNINMLCWLNHAYLKCYVPLLKSFCSCFYIFKHFGYNIFVNCKFWIIWAIYSSFRDIGTIKA